DARRHRRRDGDPRRARRRRHGPAKAEDHDARPGEEPPRHPRHGPLRSTRDGRRPRGGRRLGSRRSARGGGGGTGRGPAGFSAAALERLAELPVRLDIVADILVVGVELAGLLVLLSGLLVYFASLVVRHQGVVYVTAVIRATVG